MKPATPRSAATRRAAVLLLLAAGPALAQDTLYFSAIPDEDETRLVERFSAVAAYLSAELEAEGARDRTASGAERLARARAAERIAERIRAASAAQSCTALVTAL